MSDKADGRRRRSRGTKAGGLEPHYIVPMAPTQVQRLPPPGVREWREDDWLYEPKIDGHRTLILVNRGVVRLLSRKNVDRTREYPTLARAAANIQARSAVIDGEVAALDAEGRVSFQALQNRREIKDSELRYFAFDLLIRDGVSVMSEPLEARRAQCAQVIEGTDLGLTVDLPGTAAAVTAAVRRFNVEGVVAKRRKSAYIPPRHLGERSTDWLKWRAHQEQEFVIGGFQRDGRSIHQLIVGYYDGNGRLIFAGRIKDGFVPYDRRTLYSALAPLQVAQCPFANLPTSKRESTQWSGGISAADMRDIAWVRPQLVAQVTFTEWTEQGRLRQSAYKGLREDKSAEEVRRE